MGVWLETADVSDSLFLVTTIPIGTIAQPDMHRPNISHGMRCEPGDGSRDAVCSCHASYEGLQRWVNKGTRHDLLPNR